ncbi:MAG: hypothetical protein GY821_09460, partial [Gammaproteobacteria bacterium]|nr:hypothetical protein [Gammaproteobacteria bacterium]
MLTAKITDAEKNKKKWQSEGYLVLADETHTSDINTEEGMPSNVSSTNAMMTNMNATPPVEPKIEIDDKLLASLEKSAAEGLKAGYCKSYEDYLFLLYCVAVIAAAIILLITNPIAAVIAIPILGVAGFFYRIDYKQKVKEQEKELMEMDISQNLMYNRDWGYIESNKEPLQLKERSRKYTHESEFKVLSDIVSTPADFGKKMRDRALDLYEIHLLKGCQYQITTSEPTARELCVVSAEQRVIFYYNAEDSSYTCYVGD